MRFFDLNIALINFPGTYDAICEAANADSCFDGLDYTFWSSNGYDSDLLDIWVERDFSAPQSFDRVFIQDTNISDISLEYWNGSTFVAISSTPVKSTDTRSVLFEFTEVETSILRIVGSTTITADEEKELGSVFVFSEIGQLDIPPSGINPKRIKEQDQHKLISGKKFIFNRGRRWEVDITTKVHIGQDDIDLLQTLVKRDNDFHLWINDDSETSMNQIIEPYGFKDMLKVSVSKGNSASYYKNLFLSGVSDKLTFVEVE